MIQVPQCPCHLNIYGADISYQLLYILPYKVVLSFQNVQKGEEFLNIFLQEVDRSRLCVNHPPLDKSPVSLSRQEFINAH